MKWILAPLFAITLFRLGDIGKIVLGATACSIPVAFVCIRLRLTTIPSVLLLQRLSTAVFGFLIPLGSGVDPRLLLCAADLYFLFMISINYKDAVRSGRILLHPFVLFLLSSALGTLVAQFWYEVPSWLILSSNSVELFRSYLIAAPPDSLQILDLFHLFALLFLSAHLFAEEAELRSYLIRGLAVGIFSSAAVAVYQATFGFSEVFPNFHPFWNLEGRIPGLFSDPNAFGIFIFLLLPLVLCELRSAGLNRFLVSLFGTALVCTSLLSGSRALLIGFCSYGLVAVVRKASGIKNVPGKLSVLKACLVLFPLLCGVLFALATASTFPASIERAARTLTNPDWTGAFYGKWVLLKMAFAMWKEFPIFGIGLGEYRTELPGYLAEAGISLGGWEDNANNFYAELAAEGGLWGLSLFIASLLFFRHNDAYDKQSSWARISVASFLVLLLLGPHFYFPEVALGLGIVVASGFLPLQRPLPRPYLVAVGCLTTGITFFLSHFSDQGLYPWEAASEDHYFRWTKKEARDWVICPPSGSYELSLSVGRPSKEPLYTIAVFSQGGVKRRAIAPGHGTHTLSFECTPHKKGLFHITTSSTWIPKEENPEIHDPRPLGIMVTAKRPTEFRSKQ